MRVKVNKALLKADHAVYLDTWPVEHLVVGMTLPSYAWDYESIDAALGIR